MFRTWIEIREFRGRVSEVVVQELRSIEISKSLAKLEGSWPIAKSNRNILFITLAVRIKAYETM